MNVLVKGRGVTVSPSLDSYARRRLQFAIGAFGRRIYDVEVRVSDVNGPRGGVDKACVLAVALRSSVDRVVVRAVGATAYSAIARAAFRVRAALVRRLHRRTERHRRGVRGFPRRRAA